jgi:hypothetical protein
VSLSAAAESTLFTNVLLFHEGQYKIVQPRTDHPQEHHTEDLLNIQDFSSIKITYSWYDVPSKVFLAKYTVPLEAISLLQIRVYF